MVVSAVHLFCLEKMLEMMNHGGHYLRRGNCVSMKGDLLSRVSQTVKTPTPPIRRNDSSSPSRRRSLVLRVAVVGTCPYILGLGEQTEQCSSEVKYSGAGILRMVSKIVVTEPCRKEPFTASEGTGKKKQAESSAR